MELLSISLVNSNGMKQFTMLSSSLLERFMIRGYIRLAFRNVAWHGAEAKENVQEVTEPVSSLIPVGASPVVKLANKEVYRHDLMLAYHLTSSLVLTMILQDKHNLVSVPLEN